MATAELAHTPEVRVDRSGQDTVVWLRSGALLVGVVPALGGRMLALRLGGDELLYRNDALIDEHLHRRTDDAPPVDATMASWRNYGGDKTWPAPQGWSGHGEWPGPPDVVLDSGAYDWSVASGTNEVRITMRSEPEPRTGLRVERRLAVQYGRSGVEITSRLQNVSDEWVRWAPWNVLQLPLPAIGGGGWYAAVDQRPDPVIEMIAGTAYPRWVRNESVVHVPRQQVVGKLGVPGATGWLATALPAHTVSQRFDIDANADYPDNGSRAELWLEYPQPTGIASLGGLRPQARILESEVLGPLRHLAPGNQTDLTVELDVVAAAGAPEQVVAAGIVFEPLRASRYGANAALSGRYGLFRAGQIACLWRNARGRVIDSAVVQHAEAGTEFAPDLRMDVPASATTVELAIGSHVLDHAVVEETG